MCPNAVTTSTTESRPTTGTGTTLEVIVDVIADVNRIDPSEDYDGTLQQKDYASVSTNVVEFLTDPQRGLEQFYEVVRNGTRR